MIISGNLLEIGVKNGNGWGISEAGAGEVIASLPGLPLKLCKDRAHACDYKPDTEADAVIGKILSASRNKNNIWISAEVGLDAASRILHGKYPTNWSIFAAFQDYDPNKMLMGAKALSVSLVDYPAYPGAGYSIVPNSAAAAGYELSELDQYYRNKWRQKDTGQVQQARETPAAEGLRRALEKLNSKGK